MAATYATIDDIQTLGRKLTADEQLKAKALIPVAAAQLRLACKRYNEDLDTLIADNEDVAEVARSITVRAIMRAIDNSGGAAVSQESQSAMGYSISASYVNAGQDIYFLNNELKELGVIYQKIGVLNIYGEN